MKAARILVIAALGYAAMLAPAAQAASVEVPVPGGHVRLPAPPLPPPVVVIRGDREPDHYDREPRHYHHHDHDRRYYRDEHRRHHHYHDDYRHERYYRHRHH